MKWTVVGGAGFLGYHLANILARREIPMTLIDVAEFNLSEFPSHVTCVHGDVRDADALPALLRGSDVVIHAAAALPSWRRRDILEVNVGGTRNVLQASLEVGVPRVVYISTTAVYGIPAKQPMHETDPIVGIGPYGQSKVSAEALCRASREKGLCVSIVRPGTFIGTGRLGVFQILYDWVLHGKQIPMIGDGKNRYQLLEVSDLVEAIARMATAPPTLANDTFNVGAAKFGTVAEDLTALGEYAQSGARALPTPAWAVKPALALFEALRISPLYKWMYETADRDYVVSTDRISQQLGWRGVYSNAEALINSYQWYVEHHRDLPQGSGVTHRQAWDQGVLKLFKPWL